MTISNINKLHNTYSIITHFQAGTLFEFINKTLQTYDRTHYPQHKPTNEEPDGSQFNSEDLIHLLQNVSIQ